MKVCARCKAEFSDNSEVCPFDGEMLEEKKTHDGFSKEIMEKKDLAPKMDLKKTETSLKSEAKENVKRLPKQRRGR